ncbi:MAG TPA: tetratricopeptide repeat protein [Terriglobales bacterium]|nr:tetratricopeptide repeat protein [Terriglobales bacterium]
MKTVSLLALTAIAATGCFAQASAAPKAPAKTATDSSYEAALSDINAAKFDAALAKLQGLQDSKDGDGALYWEAYAQSKLRQNTEALATLNRLQSEYPESKFRADAEALALQSKLDAGQKVQPGMQPNDDLKLLAINSLMGTDATQALPMLEKVLNGNASEPVKSRALFVVAQNGGSAGQDILVHIASGSEHPELSQQAVRYLGMSGGASGRDALAKVYAATSSNDLKASILRSYMLGGDKTRLLAVAKSDASPELRQSAIRDLGLIGDDTDLVSLYAGPSDRATSEAVIRGLFLHNGAEQLVALARKEQDPELKRSIVRELSLTHSKVAEAYLMELLNQ